MSRDKSPFSNSDEGEWWMSQWCDICLRDAPFRNGITRTGCELILIALSGRTPAQWLGRPYSCIEFKGPGGGGGEPRPKPEPPNMDGLFERPPAQVRQFTQPAQRTEVPA
jgi:hypothetical protein